LNPVPFEPLEPGAYRELVRRALAEDFGWGDVTTETIIDREQKARGVIVAKCRCVIAGIDVAAEAFRQLDPAAQITVHRRDSERCDPGTEIAEIRGHATALLTAERTALNFLQRLCGIATLTRQFVDAAGGRMNHRGGLDDGILIKDNHVRLVGSVAAAVTNMRKGNHDMPTEVEAQTLAQVDEALEAGAEIILLDNLSTDEIVKAVQRCGGRAKTEISGGVTLQRIAELAATGADYVSVGALTHSAPAMDLSFEIEPLGS